MTEPLRLRLILGKYRVSSVSQGLAGFKMILALPNSVTMTCDVPITADVKVGDLLTLYTEVLTNGRDHPSS